VRKSATRTPAGVDQLRSGPVPAQIRPGSGPVPA
jgi:hypothetical protein